MKNFCKKDWWNFGHKKKLLSSAQDGFFINQLDYYGFRGLKSEQFSSYLNPGRQYFSWKRTISTKQKRTTDVPQGPVLGPFLFLLFVKDFDECIENSHETMFADDTTIIKSKQNAIILIDSDMRHLSKWCVDNKLTVIIQRCEAISFGSRQPHFDFLMDKALKHQKSCKWLGIHLGRDLRFREHIEFVVEKLDKFSGLIWGSAIVPKKVLANVQQFFLRNIWFVMVWVYVEQLQKLEKNWNFSAKNSKSNFFPENE